MAARFLRRCDEIFKRIPGPKQPVLGVGRFLFCPIHQMSWCENSFLHRERNCSLFPESLDFWIRCVYHYDCNHL